MIILFYEPFLSKFVNYASPKFREIKIWVWIVKDRRAEPVYEIVKKSQHDYAISKFHYIVAPSEGAYMS